MGELEEFFSYNKVFKGSLKHYARGFTEEAGGVLEIDGFCLSGESTVINIGRLHEKMFIKKSDAEEFFDDAYRNGRKDGVRIKKKQEALRN